MDEDFFHDKALEIYLELNRYYPVEIDEAVEWLAGQLKAISATPF